MSLITEIETARQKIITDDYPMSLGELTNIFKENELKIAPSFQRLFRWSNAQKSAFFESLLIGIPIPPIFVFELDDGTWELIDGLQRTSTLMEFQGLLCDDDGNLLPPSVLSSTEYLPSLKGCVWDHELANDFTEDQDMGSELRIAIKRAKIGIQILKKGSEERSKYDLFQRLNGNGSLLSPQEFRTCVMVMLNEDKYNQCNTTANDAKLLELLSLSPKKLDKQENLDFVCRFLAHYTSDIPKQYDVDEFITHEVKELFINNSQVKEFLQVCVDTAEFLHDEVDSNALRRYDGSQFSGRVGKVGFECIFMGVAKNMEAIKKLTIPKQFIMDKILSVWTGELVEKVLGASMNGNTRISQTIPFGRNHFNPHK